MDTESVLKCECGEEVRLPGGAPTAPVPCPRCARPIAPPSSAADAPSTPATPAPAGPEGAEAAGPGIEQILLKKGWVTPDQLKAARERQEAELGQGKKLRIGEALVALGFVPAERIREALGLQGKTPLRCPSCGKSYNVWGYKPGMRPQCKACGKGLVPLNTSTDLHVEDTGTQVTHVPVGESVPAGIVDLVPGYRIERQLGTGGMGTVYLARQKALDRLVAIKVLSNQLAADAAYVQRFLAEARSAARLSHENIVAAVDAGESAGSYYFVMEYAEGETLEEAIRRERAIPERRALEIAREVATGLAHAAEHGLVHRDIKPSNIILTPAGHAKICDFGLAREIHSDVRLTQAGMVHSSPAYASPEQCKGHSRLDSRADMYSLGVTLFEMLTGKLPFNSGSPSALFVAHVNEAPPVPRTLEPSLSPATNALVLRLLRKDPSQRFADYADLLAALAAARAPGPQTGQRRAPHPPAAAAPAPKSRPGGVPVPWVISGAALVGVAALAFFILGRGGPGAAAGPASGRIDNAEVERQIAQMRAAERSAQGRPSEIPALRARWKALDDSYRETPLRDLVAGPYLEFETRRGEEADRAADRLLEGAAAKVDQGHLADGLALLRGFPPAYEETPAARRIAEKANEVTRFLEDRYQNMVQLVSARISGEQFDEARKLLDELRGIVSSPGPAGSVFVRPSMGGELEGLRRKIEEAVLLARRRELEAQAKAETPKATTPAPREPETPRPATPPPPTAPTPAAPAPAPGPAAAPAASAGPKRLPVPGAAALKDSDKLIRDLFKEDYGRKAPADRLELSRKLIDLAHQTKDDPAGRYVLYTQAQELAAAAGNLQAAFSAIDELVREFDVDGRELRSGALHQVSQNAHQPEEMRALGLEMLRNADQAIAAEDFDGAIRTAQAVSALGRKAKDISLVTKADAKIRESDEAKTRFEQFKKSSDVLAKNPNDPEASLSVGRYLCGVRGDWAGGLALLAKAAPAPLKDLAGRDLAGPSEGPAMLALADAWWDLAEKEPAPGRDAYRKRSAHWYELAAPRLSGFSKVRAEKRAAELSAER